MCWNLVGKGVMWAWSQLDRRLLIRGSPYVSGGDYWGEDQPHDEGPTPTWFYTHRNNPQPSPFPIRIGEGSWHNIIKHPNKGAAYGGKPQHSMAANNVWWKHKREKKWEEKKREERDREKKNIMYFGVPFFVWMDNFLYSSRLHMALDRIVAEIVFGSTSTLGFSGMRSHRSDLYMAVLNSHISAFGGVSPWCILSVGGGRQVSTCRVYMWDSDCRATVWSA